MYGIFTHIYPKNGPNVENIPYMDFFGIYYVYNYDIVYMYSFNHVCIYPYIYIYKYLYIHSRDMWMIPTVTNYLPTGMICPSIQW